MARAPAWDDEMDAASARFRSSGGSRWKGVLIVLCLIGAATFVLGYYLPLYRAHAKLLSEDRGLRQKARSLQQSLTQSRDELQTTSTRRAELEAERKQREDAKKGELARLESVKSDLGAKLEKQSKKGTVAVALTRGQLFVSLAETLAFVPNKADLSPTGKQLLCEVAKAAGSNTSLRVVSVLAKSGDTPPTLPPEFASTWALTAARAASAAQALQEKCGVTGERVSASGHGEFEPTPLDPERQKLPARLEIEIVPL